MRERDRRDVFLLEVLMLGFLFGDDEPSGVPPDRPDEADADAPGAPGRRTGDDGES